MVKIYFTYSEFILILSITSFQVLGEKEKEFEKKKLELELEAYKKELEIQTHRKREEEMKQQHDAMRFLLDENKKELEEKKIQQENMLQVNKTYISNSQRYRHRNSDIHKFNIIT